MPTRIKLAAILGAFALLVHPAIGISACLQHSALASECAEDCGRMAPIAPATQAVPAPTPNSSCCQVSATRPETSRDAVRSAGVGFIGVVDAGESAGQPVQLSRPGPRSSEDAAGRAAPSLQALYATFLI